MNNKDYYIKMAFTLAEVLITLGVIGIVAAMTLPGVIKGYQDRARITKLKKVYSQLNQVAQMARYDYGMDSGTFPVYWGDPKTDNVAFRDAFMKHFKVGKVCDAKQLYGGYKCGMSICTGPAFVAADGVSYGFSRHQITVNLSAEQPKSNSGQHCYSTAWDKYRKNIFIFYYDGRKVIPQRNTSGEGFAIGASSPDDKPVYVNSKSTVHVFHDNHTAWVFDFDNMDFLYCPEKLSWGGKHSCKE